MFNKKIKQLNIVILLSAILLVSACGTNIIKPIRKDVVGHSTVRNVTIVALGSAKSPAIAARVKNAVEKEAKKELRGNMQVDLKITLDQWVGSEHLVGGSFTSTLLGSKTHLNGIVDILDTRTGEVIGKYSIYSEYKEGGLLSAQRTISFIETDKYVIDNFATFTINYLE